MKIVEQNGKLFPPPTSLGGEVGERFSSVFMNAESYPVEGEKPSHSPSPLFPPPFLQECGGGGERNIKIAI
jgi:hypothetical protein